MVKQPIEQKIINQSLRRITEITCANSTLSAWDGAMGSRGYNKVILMGVFYARSELVAARAEWRKAGKTVVFTNGCYDILHPGHIRLLERARSLGDILILALNTDDSVARLKGPSRPLLAETERARMALALAAVDAVTFFGEDTPRELIAAVLPDILIKGADWA